MNIVAIIQARMGSTRLPGKVMLKIQDTTILEYVVRRVQDANEINGVVIATTIKQEDEVIIKEADRLGVHSFIGSEGDVLSRYYHAAQKFNADIIIRITSDCPMIDPVLLDTMVKAFKSQTCDYLSNTLSRTYPRGLDCEVFSFDALERCYLEAQRPHQREHVTPYIYENPDSFTIKHFEDQENNSMFRCTLDTIEDFEFLKITMESLGEHYSYNELIHFLKSNSEVVEINKKIVQKELEA